GAATGALRMKLLRGILRTGKGRILLAALLFAVGWQGWLSLAAPGKLAPAVQASPGGKVNLLVTLAFPPERLRAGIPEIRPGFRHTGQHRGTARCQQGGPALGRPPVLGGQGGAATNRRSIAMKRAWITGLLLSLSALAFAQAPIKMKAGMVAAIDQMALPIAVERGFFEKEGLDVTIARPYATGVDALNALQAGEADLIQVGVPMIGAVLRGMDLVAVGNYT